MTSFNLSLFFKSIKEAGENVSLEAVSMSFYGLIGRSLDERDWSLILNDENPYQASIDALVVMYADSDYLLRNALHLGRLGYSANQVVHTYNQLSNFLQFEQDASWAIGSTYEDAALSSFQTVRAAAALDYSSNLLPPPVPVLSFSNNGVGLLVSSNQNGVLSFEDGTFITNLTADVDYQFEIRGALVTSRVKATGRDGDSALSSQYFTIGTNGNDTYDASGAGGQVDYIDLGAGDDVIVGGAGADIIYAGAGDDTIRAEQTDVRIDGGDGNDTLELSANFTAVADQIFNVENITATANGITIVLTAFNFGGTINSFAAGATTVTGSIGNDTFVGGAGDDFFSGHQGNDIFTGNGGNDTYTGGTGTNRFNANSGTDTVTNLQGNDVFVVSLGADIRATVSNDFTATAASQNLGGANSDAVFTVDTNASVADFSAMTVVNAATDGVTIQSGGAIIRNATYSGSDGNDSISTSGTLFGSRYTINANDGDDVVIGNSGIDIINGGDGDDVIRGNRGVDSLDGGPGADIYEYRTSTDGTSLINITNTGDASDDFDAVAGTDTDSVTFIKADDSIRVDGALEGALEALAARGTSAAALDFDAVGIYLIRAADANLDGDDFGDVSDIAANANIGFGASVNAAAGDAIMFTIENNAATQTGVYYFIDNDATGTVTAGDRISLLGILSDTNLTAADFIL